MRIALVINAYPPRVGGVEFHALNLAQELAELGHKVWVLGLASNSRCRTEKDVTIVTRKSLFSIADVIAVPPFGTTGRITRFLREEKIEVVSIHTRFFPMTFVGLRAAQKIGIPVVHTEHGSDYVATSNPIIWAGSRLVDLTVGRYVLNHADRVLGVSEEVVRFVWKLAGVKADVFYNAVAPSTSNGAYTDRPQHLVFAGRIVAGKGWDVFLESIARLRAEGYAVDGELLGTGTQFAAAMEKMRDLHLENVVRAPGRVSPEEVRKSLRGATLINPSVLSEGFQTTLVETLIEKGRVVTFPVPGAQMLKDLSAPLVICQNRDTNSMIAGIRRMLDSPLPIVDTSIYDALTWPAQARVFSRYCQELHKKNT